MSTSTSDGSPERGPSLPRGAYGFRIPALGRSRLLVPAPPSWPPLRVERRLLRGSPPARSPGDARGVLHLLDGGVLELDPPGRAAVYSTPAPLSDDDLAHPYLAAAAGAAAGWLRRDALHAGAFLARDGGAWALLAGKGGGKSTTLAWLAVAGFGVVTDDILVLDGMRALAGPRCLDLRRDAAAALATGRRLDASRGGERRRLRLPAVPAETPFRGFVVLEWGDRLELDTLPPAERLGRIAAQRLRRDDDAGRELLDLVARPCLVLRRPRGLDGLAAVAEQLVRVPGGG